MVLNDWLSRRRLYTPHRVAVVDDTCGQRYDYAALDARALRLAHRMQVQLGVHPGDHVACLSSNRIEYIDLYFACGKIGAVLVPINSRLPAVAVGELLADCQAKVFFYEMPFAEFAEAVGKSIPGVQQLPIEESEYSLSESRTPVETYSASESDTAMILYTSGTTGQAKGAMITYRQIHWNALNTIIGLQLTQNDVAYMNMPLHHTGGWHVLFTPLMLLGGRVVLQQRFDAQRCNQLLGPEQITILFGVPTMLRMQWEARNFSQADFSYVRFAIFGGEPCPLPVIEAYGNRGVPMRQGYGLTEAGPNCFSLPAEDAIRKQGSIGFPNFHVDASLRREDGSEANSGEVGELFMRGPHLFAGYWNNAEETTNVLQQGWLATGDLMTRDEEGYYFVVGRKKEMYVSGGENVYPTQVERVLQKHGAVALAAVVGVPHPKWGETGWAFVQLHPECTCSEADLLAWCSQHLASFQCPARFMIVDDLPVGDSGKVDKRALSRIAAATNND